MTTIFGNALNQHFVSQKAKAATAGVQLFFTTAAVVENPAGNRLASVIVFITLANIWRSHFRTVFDRTPFTTAAVLASIRLDISKRIDEDHVHTLL
ncbi:hypothetical protein HMPREF1544_06210 [Mucor circinelloides 1006PhL]|uniref:Uncharacterized protein n=1 Tax=Mucor circinelloides f. circinelloides (strain 1006PhL) TaxID=1220926 RepID=S2JEU7_MUCC1|nr:hypothetical protein HMPREF1544_06210 [Mucor circinelloides 1006PhL]